MRKILVIAILFLAGSVNAQFSISGGTSVLKGFGTPKPWFGLHLGVEVPRDDAISFYARATHHFRRKSSEILSGNATAINSTTTPVFQSLTGVPSMDYTIIEGGTRYYLGDGFDYGFAAYGGTNIKLVFNKVRVDYEGFDSEKYTLDGQTRTGGWIFNVGAGLGGGLKYTVPRWGTFYFDIGLSYLLLSQPSTQSVTAVQYSNLLFDMTLGYRHDIGW